MMCKLRICAPMQEAYAAMLSNPVPEVQLDCMQRLVHSLCNADRVQLLCALPFSATLLVREGVGGVGGGVGAAPPAAAAAALRFTLAPRRLPRLKRWQRPQRECFKSHAGARAHAPPRPSHSPAHTQPGPQPRAGLATSPNITQLNALQVVREGRPTWVTLLEEVAGCLQRRADSLSLDATPQPYKVRGVPLLVCL